MTEPGITREQADRIISLLERIARNTERAANAAVGHRGPWEFTVQIPNLPPDVPATTSG